MAPRLAGRGSHRRRRRVLSVEPVARPARRHRGPARWAPRSVRQLLHLAERSVPHGGPLVLTTCWSVKGGTGTTVVTVALGVALAAARSPDGALVVDLAGDVPAAFRLAPGAAGAPGLAEWLAAAPSVLPDALFRLEVAGVADGSAVLPCGAGGPGVRWRRPSWRRCCTASAVRWSSTAGASPAAADESPAAATTPWRLGPPAADRFAVGRAPVLPGRCAAALRGPPGVGRGARGRGQRSRGATSSRSSACRWWRWCGSPMLSPGGSTPWTLQDGPQASPTSSWRST